MDKEIMGWHSEDYRDIYGLSLTPENAPLGLALGNAPLPLPDATTGQPPAHLPRVRRRPSGCPGCGNFIGTCPDCPYTG